MSRHKRDHGKASVAQAFREFNGGGVAGRGDIWIEAAALLRVDPNKSPLLLAGQLHNRRGGEGASLLTQEAWYCNV
jgi:hypothetical protein